MVLISLRDQREQLVFEIQQSDSLVGTLRVKSVVFCQTLEQSVIPAGTYPIKMEWSTAYRQVLPTIQEMPDMVRRLGMIKPGSTDKGYIQLSFDETFSEEAPSKLAFRHICELIQEAEVQKVPIRIIIKEKE